MDILSGLGYLTVNERFALKELLEHLVQEHKLQVLQVVLFGSAARGDRGEDSDVDLLILMLSEDWRDYEPIRDLAAGLSTQYDIFLSPKVMGIRHFQRVKRVQPLFYQNIRKDGVELFRTGNSPGLAKVRQVWVAETDTA